MNRADTRGAQHFYALVCRSFQQFIINRLTSIHDCVNILSCLNKIKSRLVSTVIICRDDHLSTKIDRETMYIRTRRRDKHHARTIIVRKNKRPLYSPCGNNHLLCAHAPESLTQPGLLGVPFDDRQHIVIVVSCNRTVGESANIGPTVHFCGYSLNPLHCGLSVNLSRCTEQPASGLTLIIHKQNPGTTFTGNQSGG